MPNTDIRIQVTFPSHWKTRKLEKLTGAEGVKCLIFLWCFAGVNKSDGDFAGMSDFDIEDAAYWTGEPGDFTDALIKCGFLEGEESNRLLHDWTEHNKWCAEFSIRSDRNRKNIESRWNTDGIQPEYDSNTSCNTTSKVGEGKERKGSVREGKAKDCGKKESDNMATETRQITDLYQKFYLERFQRKPAWGALEGKRIKELLARYPVADILKAIEIMFTVEDDLITKNIGVFVSCMTQRMIDRALTLKPTQTLNKRLDDDTRFGNPGEVKL